ncbi:esterase [Arthrobacter phage Faja]|uniref:Esterase n=1 Tax=Arthrobacter phage Faja TaxID=2419957 RepID=A0A3G2KG05_9CAUD|nr:esterase [Arthrobacter phage Faja]AYN57885.1 esterase [Arthrobacter phage Faja]
MTIGRQIYGVHATDGTDSAGVNIRYWLPPVPATQLVIYCHQLGATEQIATNYWAYPMIHAAVQNGSMVVASRAHSDNWGNDASITDVVNAYNFMNAINPVSSVVLVGASMGGLDALLVAAKGSLPAGKLKGVYLVDAVTDLSWAYTATAAGTPNAFQSSINAAYGVASFAAIPAGHDPRNSFAASAYAGLRLRFFASTADTTVDKASNTDAFRTFISGTATESALVTHNPSGHTQTSNGKDLTAFLTRCV